MTNDREARSYRSEIAAAVHEMMEDAFDADVVREDTLRAPDEVCFAPTLV